jgi:glutathione synthase/RimK-type ligase-like ATP-grasp enzyme
MERLRLAPTIFQELIEGPRDVRVTMIGTTCFAAAMESGSSQHVDSRLALDVPVAGYELPACVQASLVRLMTRLGLKFAAVDIKESSDGTFYFLELNPQGQFLYVEILTGLPIAAAMAKYLTDLDAQS